MSNIVKDIRVAFTNVIATTLGDDYAPLKYKLDLAANDFTKKDKRYGVVTKAGVPVISMLKNYTMDRDYTVILSTGYVNINGDDAQQDAIDELEDKFDNILVDAINSKLGLPSKVVNLVISSIDEPDFTIENTVTIEASFTVTYRRKLNN